MSNQKRLKTIEKKQKDFPALWLAFLIPVLISFLICAGKGVYPFGERCILHMDMYHQYCPFFREFLEKLTSGDSLMYSWNIGLGSDFYSVYVYYLASPMNWLIFLCPKTHVIEFMTILIITKMGLAGAGFFWFIRDHYRLKAEGTYRITTVIPALVFSTGYALSGFVAVYNWDIMWMDCVALAPVIILGLERLVKEKKVVLYYAALSLSILSNYYLSIMICIFLCFAFLGFLMDQLGRGWKSRDYLAAMVRFAICSILAGGSGLVMMLPEMKILSLSGSGGISFPEKVEWYFNILAELARTSATVETYAGNEYWPNLYAGMFTLLLAGLYLTNRRISWKKQLSRFFMCAFFVVSFANNWLDFIWHGFHFPDSLPGRQSFLFAFLLLDMAYEVWEKRGGNTRIQIGLTSLFASAILAAGAWVGDETITDPENVLIGILFLLCFASGLILERITEGKQRNYVRIALAVLAVAELTVNMGITGFSTTSRTGYVAHTESYEKLLDLAERDAIVSAGVEEASQVFYRVEDTERHCKNDDAFYGYHSATQFSSLMNIHVSHFFQDLYMEGGKNYYCYNGATPLTSAMLSVQYVISDAKKTGNSLRTAVGEEDGFTLYRNNFTLPLGYMMDEEAVTSFEKADLSRIDTINYLGELLGSEENLLSPVSCVQEKEYGETRITLLEDGIYYASIKDCKPDYLTIRYEDGSSVSYSKTTHKYLFEIGECTAREMVRVTNSKSEETELQLYRLNVPATEQAYVNLMRQTMELTSYSSTSLEGKIHVNEAGRLILSIPAEEGWTLYVDGKKTEVLPFKKAFISLPLAEGEHQIRLSYRTPGLVAGALGSLACMVLFIAYAVLRRKYEKNIG